METSKKGNEIKQGKPKNKPTEGAETLRQLANSKTRHSAQIST